MPNKFYEELESDHEKEGSMPEGKGYSGNKDGRQKGSKGKSSANFRETTNPNSKLTKLKQQPGTEK